MKKFNFIALISLVITFVLTAIATQIVLKFLNFPVIDYFYLLPTIFVVMGIIMIIMVNKVNVANANRLAQNILLIKSVKISVMLLLGVVYVLVLHVNIRMFLVLMAVFYLVYLAFESIVLMKFEKLIKKINE